MQGNKDHIQTSVPEVPVTVARAPYPSKDAQLPNAGVARATQAADASAPDGTPMWATTGSHPRQTVLQQHCEFFDADGDGVIWPLDTFRGFYALGFNLVFSALAMLIIHVNFSYVTCPGILPDPFFRLYLDNIHRAKHGSDSGTYDNEGRFIPQKFEDFFSKYAEGKDGLTFGDILAGLKGQRVIMDPVGWFGALFEWCTMYIMLWPEDGVMKKDDVRRVFDGSIFYEVAARRGSTYANTKSQLKKSKSTYANAKSQSKKPKST